MSSRPKKGTAATEMDRGGRWHALEPAEVLAQLESDGQRGLSEHQVRHRQQRYGSNVLTEAKGRSPVTRFLLQFHQPLIYILLAATAVTAALEEWVDASVIFGVVLINAVIGFVQEAKALQAIEALTQRMGAAAHVVRGGRRARIAAPEIVPGDVVLLGPGDRVPADLRLIEVKELQVDESALTGESIPVQKSAHPVQATTELADRTSMAYVTTLVTRGQARAVVTATGDRTEIGHISELISSAQELRTPLTQKIASFSHRLLFVILALAALTFALGLVQGQGLFEVFMAAVALMVGAIPEGLPAAITIMLAMGVSRMARRRAIIRKLPAVETLGSTTVICSDKTGTLTENQMTAVRAWAGQQSYRYSGVGYAPEGHVELDATPIDPQRHPALRLCVKTGLLCNDSELMNVDGRWGIEGDPTEGALLTAAHKAGLDPDGILEEEPRLDVVPFESEHQYMATLHGSPSGERTAYIKGSVEAILRRTSRWMTADGTVAEIRADEVKRQAEQLASEGLRVLAFAYRPLPPDTQSIDHSTVEREVVFLGLQGLVDPPRQEAKEAIAECHRAGIAVKMITGDHALTARTIAQQLGIGGDNETGELETVRGAELAAMSDEELASTVARVHVFARVSPEQKLRLVTALQALGHVAAMTGDGVNDAPALRRANIGIAMGITGTDVAKASADMILTDDNFATIEAAVEEGRGVFDNLTKFIVWTLPTNVGEGLIILAAAVFATALPITPVQILWINMTTAVLLGLTLAFEPKESDLMARPPRPADEPILTYELVLRTIFVGTLLLVASFGLFRLMLHWGAAEAAARTTAVNAIVVGEMFYLFNCRSLLKPLPAVGLWSNPWVYAGAVAMMALQMLFTYVPFMNLLFGTAPIGLVPWAWIFGAGLAIFLLVHIEKHIRLRVGSRKQGNRRTAHAAHGA